MTAALSYDIAWFVWPTVAVLCAALDSLYCGMETGIYVLNKVRLELKAESGSKAARSLRRMVANPNNLLAVLLIGTNIMRYLVTFSITSMFVMAGYSHNAEWYTLAVAAPLLFVTVDAVPKGVFRRAAEVFVYRLTWLLRGSNWLFNATGVALLVRGIASLPMRLASARQGARSPLGPLAITTVVAEGHASGLLTAFQSVMANRVLHISNVTLRDAMNPMTRVVSAPVGVGRRQLMETIARHNYSRLPLVDDGEQVVSIVDIYDVLTDVEDARPADKASPPFVLPAAMSVIDAVYRMQRERRAMAVVCESGGRHVGIVTMKDLVEEIVGELAAW